MKGVSQWSHRLFSAGAGPGAIGRRVDDEAEGLVVYDPNVGKKLGGHCLLEAFDAQNGLCSSNARVVMGLMPYSQMYSGMNLCGRQAFHARLSSLRLEPKALNEGRKIAWVSPT